MYKCKQKIHFNKWISCLKKCKKYVYIYLFVCLVIIDSTVVYSLRVFFHYNQCKWVNNYIYEYKLRFSSLSFFFFSPLCLKLKLNYRGNNNWCIIKITCSLFWPLCCTGLWDKKVNKGLVMQKMLYCISFDCFCWNMIAWYCFSHATDSRLAL